MSLLSETFPDTAEFNSVAFNTGTLFDLQTGGAVQGVDGKMYLTGGLGCHINSFVGENSNFKSTISAGLLSRAFSIYNDGGLIIYDTENSISQDKLRICGATEELRDRFNFDDVKWISGTTYSLEDLDELILKHCQQKQEKAKDYMIETPFADRFGKPVKCFIPTFLFIDSFSMAHCNKEEEMLNDFKSGKSGLGDSNSNTVYMKDGNKKTIWTQLMVRRCERFGIVLVLTGHYGKRTNMDPYEYSPKATTFARQGMTVTGVGSKFKFLSSVYAVTQANLLTDSSKEALYPNGDTSDTDVFAVNMRLERCKGAQAGTIVPFVCSQTQGALNAATYYHYIREHEYYGCQGSKQRQQLNLMPDKTISRGTIRALAEADPQLVRALEITAHFCFIKDYHQKYLHDHNKDPKSLFDELMSDKNKDLKQELLNSRSYWSYKKEDKPYMSVFDILNIIK